MNLDQTIAKESQQCEEDETVVPVAPDAFPAVRYFQVHFEHIEELIGEMRIALEVVKAELAELRNNAGMDGFSSSDMRESAKRAGLCPPMGNGRRRRN